ADDGNRYPVTIPDHLSMLPEQPDGVLVVCDLELRLADDPAEGALNPVPAQGIPAGYKEHPARKARALRDAPCGDHPGGFLGVSPCGDQHWRALGKLGLVFRKRDNRGVEVSGCQLNLAQAQALIRFDEPVVTGIRMLLMKRQGYSLL